MNLTTNYLGMVLKNPIVASSSPLSHTVDSIRRLEDAGAAAVVMYSLFEEQIGFDSYYIDYHLTQGVDSYAESISYFPDMQSYNVGPDEYLNLIRRAKEAVDIPIIGSLNGASVGGWTDYATLIEEAGADALELNIYYLPANTAGHRSRGRSTLSRHSFGCATGGKYSGGSEAQSVLQLDRKHGKSFSRSRRGWPGPIQSLLSTGFRSGKS